MDDDEAVSRRELLLPEGQDVLVDLPRLKGCKRKQLVLLWRSLPDMVIALDHPFVGRQLPEAHWAARMQPLCGYRHLGPQA